MSATFYVKVTYDGRSEWDTQPYTERRAEREVSAWKRRDRQAKAYRATPEILAQVAAQVARCRARLVRSG